MRIYLAGPMRGIPEMNMPRFRAVTAALRADGHEVFNPAEHTITIYGDVYTGNERGDETITPIDPRRVFADDLEYICKYADTVMLLPGWEKSLGAQAEWRAAIALESAGVSVVYLTEERVRLMERAAELESTNA